METRTAQETVEVTFNGESRTVTYQPHEAVEAVLNRALNEFGIQQNRHVMSLFTTDNRELPDKDSMQDAGVKPGDVLILRQSTVKGVMPLLRASQGMLDATFDHFRQCGAGRRECVAYWSSSVGAPRHVDRVEHPRHGATGYGYEVDSAWVTAFFLQLRYERRTARLQVHTHPRWAGHSETDDRFALVPAPGFLSLVIPDFGLGPVGLDAGVLVSMDEAGDWVPCSLSEIDAPGAEVEAS